MYGITSSVGVASVSPAVVLAPKNVSSSTQLQSLTSNDELPATEAPVVSSHQMNEQRSAPATQEVEPTLSATIRSEAYPAAPRHASTAAGSLFEASVESGHSSKNNSTTVPRQCGVGVYLRQAQEGFIEVKATEPGCSSDEKLFEGDIMSAVDGTACIGLSLRDITRLIIGEEGSCVTITVIRQMPISPSSGKTFMKEVPVLLTRRPLPQQRSSRDIRALSESRLQTPRGDVSGAEHANAPALLQRSGSLPSLSSDSKLLDRVQDSKVDALMRQFLVSNTGSLPLKLSVYDRDDVLRVCEVVAPFLQYPVEPNTCVHAFLPTVSCDSSHVLEQVSAAAVRPERARGDTKRHQRVLPSSAPPNTMNALQCNAEAAVPVRPLLALFPVCRGGICGHSVSASCSSVSLVA